MARRIVLLCLLLAPVCWGQSQVLGNPPLSTVVSDNAYESINLATLARIIRDFEDKRSLLCYKHVD
jgi:hypothetical protein